MQRLHIDGWLGRNMVAPWTEHRGSRDLRELSGMAPSSRGYFHARPDAGRVEQVLKFYGLEGLGGEIPPD